MGEKTDAGPLHENTDELQQMIDEIDPSVSYSCLPSVWISMLARARAWYDGYLAMDVMNMLTAAPLVYIGNVCGLYLSHALPHTCSSTMYACRQ